jgi:hypothetical protein
MKSATLPSLRVHPDLRDAAQAVLTEGESLSSFIETSVREAVARRRAHAEFVARGLAARDQAKATAGWFDADAVHASLRGRLEAARSRLANSTPTA